MANLNKSEKFLKNTTAAWKHVPNRPILCINRNPPLLDSPQKIFINYFLRSESCLTMFLAFQKKVQKISNISKKKVKEITKNLQLFPFPFNLMRGFSRQITSVQFYYQLFNQFLFMIKMLLVIPKCISTNPMQNYRIFTKRLIGNWIKLHFDWHDFFSSNHKVQFQIQKSNEFYFQTVLLIPKCTAPNAKLHNIHQKQDLVLWLVLSRPLTGMIFFSSNHKVQFQI